MKKIIYPGSFDPLTFGHLDVLERAVKIFDKVIVAVAGNSEKTPLFSFEERIEMLRIAAKDNPKIEVDSFNGLLVEYASKKGASVILRGLRALSDFEYEFQMALTNRKLYENIETIFMMPSESYSYLSSRMIKEIASMGGDVRDFVPDYVAARLKARIQNRK